MKSKTPRTDAEFKLEAFFDGSGIVETVFVEFARELEKELIEARAEIKESQAEAQELYRQLATELKAEHAEELAEARAEIESLTRSLTIVANWENVNRTYTANEVKEFARGILDVAALEAAERGEG
jgi:Skp family chaperone for outer membrane proteins